MAEEKPTDRVKIVHPSLPKAEPAVVARESLPHWEAKGWKLHTDKEAGK